MMIHRSRNKSTKGASEILGLVLLISLSIVTSIFVVATLQGGPISALQEQSQSEQVKTSFSQISSSSVGAAIGGTNSTESVSTPFASINNPILVSEQGSITVESYTDESATTGTVLLEKDLGHISFENNNSNQTTYYQNGAVWIISDNGAVETLTPPEFDYQQETLTLPLIKIQSDTQIATDGITFTHEETSRSIDQLATSDTVIEITIEGETYRGWGKYFETRFNEDIVSYDTENDSVTVTLGTAPQTYNEIDNEVVTLQGSLSGKPNTTINGDIVENSPQKLPAANSLIEDEIEYAKNNGQNLNNQSEIDSGVYYTDSLNVTDENLTVDLSEGNVTLAVEGDVELDSGNINVTNTEGGVLRTYVKGDVLMRTHGEWTIEGQDYSTNRVFGRASSTMDIQPNSVFEGVYYAPGDGCEYSQEGTEECDDSGGNGGGPPGRGSNAECGPTTSLCMQPNSNVRGAYIGDSAALSPNTTLTFDDSLEEVQIESTTTVTRQSRPDLSYFYTSTTVVNINQKGETGGQDDTSN